MKITEAIEKQFGGWTRLLKPWIEDSGELEKVYAFLKSQVQAKRVVIPKSADVFRSLALCPPESVRAIIFLMDPYPSITKEGVMVADGVPLSCVNTGYLQPSLELFYQAIENDYLGFEPSMDYRPDNSYLLTEEGVLLINSSLTTEKDKPGIHAQNWLPFMQYLIEDVINKYMRGLPIVMCGAQAQKLEKYINPLIHHIRKVEHPAAASHQNRAWNHDGIFKWIDNIARGSNGYGITWYRKKEGKSSKTEVPAWVTDKSKKGQKSAKELGLPWSD